MLLQIPDEDVLLQAGDAKYLVHADWTGVHDIVSECGWWMGQICVVQHGCERHVDWLYAYSINFEETE